MAQEINWVTWKRRGIAKVWESSLLTLDINPQMFTEEPLYQRLRSPNLNISKYLPGTAFRDYEDRLEELKAAITKEEFGARKNGGLEAKLWEVKLDDIAKWAMRHSVDIPAELREMIEDDGEGQAPQQAYPGKSDKLAYLNQASQRFWGKFDPEKPTENLPLQKDVAEWLKSKGFSDRLATSGATIIAPETAHKGRRPKP
jgi:hypothetical protein